MNARTILSAAAVAIALSTAPLVAAGGSADVALPALDDPDPFPVGTCVRVPDLDPRPICILIDPDEA